MQIVECAYRGPGALNLYLTGPQLVDQVCYSLLCRRKCERAGFGDRKEPKPLLLGRRGKDRLQHKATLVQKGLLAILDVDSFKPAVRLFGGIKHHYLVTVS